MCSRPVCPAHTKHLAERVKPPKHSKKSGRRGSGGDCDGFQGAVVRPSTAGETRVTASEERVMGADGRYDII